MTMTEKKLPGRAYYPEPVVSTRRAAQLLDVSPRTIARWIREGRLSAVKIGRVWRVPESEIRRLTSV